MDGKAKKVLVFAGTTEGRELCARLAALGADVTASVATGYGLASMARTPGVRVRAGRLGAEEIRALARDFPLVVDATHPYAAEATRNIRAACREVGVEYLRLLRPPQEGAGDVAVPDAAAAAAYLRGTEGNILLTTGSRELSFFAALPGFGERCFARVLPSAEAIEACRAAGLSGRHIIGMQGPFSAQMNLALLREVEAAFLVTKESGAAGGFAEKLAAAARAGAATVVIGRPETETGLDFGRALEYLVRRLELEEPKSGGTPLPAYGTKTEKERPHMEGVLILAHGSREDDTEKTMDAIAEMVQQKLPGTLIETAYLQFRSRDLAAGLEKLVAAGADDIRVVPYFLFDGVHIRHDIPAEIEEFRKKRPDVRVALGGTLGADGRLADVLADRIRESL